MIRSLINIWNKGSKIEYAGYIERCMVVMLDDSNNRICFIRLWIYNVRWF